MYPPFSLLAILLLCHTTCALALPAPADLSSPLSLVSSNLTTTSDSATIGLQNATTNPANFLGVQCYHLLPDTVSLESCQPLFAKLIQDRDVYEERDVYNGSRFQSGINPCTIMISSPDRRDIRVSVSVADIVVYATEVLQTCRETSTGGANTFEGAWRVVVTKYPLKNAAEDRV